MQSRFLSLLPLLLVAGPVPAQWMISGNESKIDLITGSPRVVKDASSDSLTLMRFDTFPPRVATLPEIPNSVIGPPSNIAFSPDGHLALIANSLVVEPMHQTNWTPEAHAHILDLSLETPAVIGRVATGQQPSGMSFHPSGKLALVANRADGSVSVLRVNGKEVTLQTNLQVGEAADSVSDVAIHPDGAMALVSLQKAGCLAVLKIEEESVTDTERRISVYGNPYRCVITPDGKLGLTAGQGNGNGLDEDALSVIDLSGPEPKAVDYVPIGAGPESIEVSPDGKLVAAVLMNGSNLPPDDPARTDHGLLTLLARDGMTYEVVQQLPIGAIPEGVAFSPDGRYLVVQCHPDRELRFYRVRGRKVRELDYRSATPGFPSSLRAGPNK